MRFFLASLRYLRTVLKHRWALYLAARKLRVPLRRVLRHDNSKFSWLEWRAYVRRFELKIQDPEEWARAWEHHWRHNDHHIEYWEDRDLIMDGRTDRAEHHPSNTVIIPDEAMREVIADWMAASYAYAGAWPKAPDWKWGNANLVRELCKLYHHPDPMLTTRGFAIALLQAQGMITRDQELAALAHP